MPYCRDCATEYDEILPWCPHCGTEGTNDLEEWEIALMDASDLVVVYGAGDEVQALLYRTMLEEAGIDVIERPLEAEWLEGVMQEGLHSQLLVREEDAEHALYLIDSFRTEAEEGILSETIPEESEDDMQDADEGQESDQE